MSDILIEEIRKIIDLLMCPSLEIYDGFLTRVAKGKPTRDEEKASHFCVYFLPYNPKTKRVFIVHHKKSGLWLSPGGHIDKGETLHKTLRREIKEELGFVYKPSRDLLPFLLTITPINNIVHPCKTHYDLWYGIKTDGNNFQVDFTEFHDVKWLTIDEAREIVTDEPNLQAISKIRHKFF